MNTRPAWFWCLFCAVTMSLGWGLRGSIGGGSLGAMIPGAMIGLALCFFLGRESDAGLIAALGAVGVGFGGQETYGQTVGLSLHPETFWWAILGFGLKGAAWGLLGGAFLGMALDRDKLPNRRILLALAAMVLGTWAGWAVIDHPKLMYFSNRLEKPREEMWAGLWVGGLCLLAVLRARVPAWFALFGCIGGGLGFAFGASLQPWGKGLWREMPLGWWKAMELSFGAILGVSYAWCAWRLRKELTREGSQPEAATPAWTAILSAAIAIGLAIYAGEELKVRFSYTVAGAVLAALILYSKTLAWQTAITTTYAAFTWDLHDQLKWASQEAIWTFLVISTIVVSVLVARYARARTMFLLLTWTAIANSFRYLQPPLRPEPMTMIPLFVVFAILISWLGAKPQPEPRPV
ncbi:hypothetical protein [Paludibaculum fermentans]|uniref:hypothetical protein n=1 Tax=Paludibaculum fermentans TaxID=1473598 RepID=UPI003EBB3F61